MWLFNGFICPCIGQAAYKCPLSSDWNIAGDSEDTMLKADKISDLTHQKQL
jgi:hypothetical protein